MSEAIILFRCVHCGKWSHAQRKPSSHERRIRDGEPAEHNAYEGTPARRVALASGYAADAILEEVVGGYEQTAADDDTWVPGWVTVRCGPFETWTASPA